VDEHERALALPDVCMTRQERRERERAQRR
jgi:hypothetical protein